MITRINARQGAIHRIGNLNGIFIEITVDRQGIDRKMKVPIKALFRKEIKMIVQSILEKVFVR